MHLVYSVIYSGRRPKHIKQSKTKATKQTYRQTFKNNLEEKRGYFGLCFQRAETAWTQAGRCGGRTANWLVTFPSTHKNLRDGTGCAKAINPQNRPPSDILPPKGSTSWKYHNFILPTGGQMFKHTTLVCAWACACVHVRVCISHSNHHNRWHITSVSS